VEPTQSKYMDDQYWNQRGGASRCS